MDKLCIEIGLVLNFFFKFVENLILTLIGEDKITYLLLFIKYSKPAEVQMSYIFLNVHKLLFFE